MNNSLNGVGLIFSDYWSSSHILRKKVIFNWLQSATLPWHVTNVIYTSPLNDVDSVSTTLQLPIVKFSIFIFAVDFSVSDQNQTLVFPPLFLIKKFSTQFQIIMFVVSKTHSHSELITCWCLGKSTSLLLFQCKMNFFTTAYCQLSFHGCTKGFRWGRLHHNFSSLPWQSFSRQLWLSIGICVR